MRDEFGREIMAEFTALTPKTYSCLLDGNDKNNAKGTINCFIK